MPPRLYSKSSPSASVAVIGLPMSCPAPVFSAIDRVAVSLLNAGARFSSMSVILIVMSIESVRFPSETLTVTEYASLSS